MDSVIMKNNLPIKIFVLLFSIMLGTVVVWQMTKNMSGSQSSTKNTNQEENNTTPEIDSGNPPVIISTKNPSGSVQLLENQEAAPPVLPSSKSITMPLFKTRTPKREEDDTEKEKTQDPPPILPSSKSGIFLPPAEEK